MKLRVILMKPNLQTLVGTCVGAMTLYACAPAFAQTVTAPGAIDNVSIFAPTADTTMDNIRSDNQAQLPGEPVPTWFGLWAIDGGSGLGRRSYVTFNESSA